MQSADVAVGDGIVDRHRSTQPIGTPEQVIECIRRVQWGISLEKLILHFSTGHAPEKAEKSLRPRRAGPPAVQPWTRLSTPRPSGRPPTFDR